MRSVDAVGACGYCSREEQAARHFHPRLPEHPGDLMAFAPLTRGEALRRSWELGGSARQRDNAVVLRSSF